MSNKKSKTLVNKMKHTHIYDLTKDIEEQQDILRTFLDLFEHHHTCTFRRWLCVLYVVRFSCDVMRSMRGQQNMFEHNEIGEYMRNGILFKSSEIITDIRAILDTENEKEDSLSIKFIKKEMLTYILQQTLLLHHLIKSIWDQEYIQEKTKENLLVYQEELIQTTWHPKRFCQWCLDVDEYRDIFSQQQPKT